MKNPKLFVGNLSSKVEKKDIEDLFEKYGRVKDITLKEKKENYAFVEFEDMRDAEEALDKENGQEFFGKRLRIEFSHGGKTNRGERFDSNTIKNSSCYICMRKGHWARECPKNEGRTIVMGKCFKCGSSRHKIQDCPKNRSRSRSRSKSSRGRSSSYGSRRHRRNESRSRSRSYSRDRNRRQDERRKSSRSGSLRRDVRDGRDNREVREGREQRDTRENRDQKRMGGGERRRRSVSNS